MKNNFFVSIGMLFVFVFWFFSGVGAYIWFAIDAFGEDIGLTLELTLMLAVLPTGFFIWGIYMFGAKLYLDEAGITKRLFGIKIKSWKWEEIKYIYFRADLWVCLCKEDTSKNSHKKREPGKLTILFSKTKKKCKILEQYIPDNLRSQITNQK